MIFNVCIPSNSIVIEDEIEKMLKKLDRLDVIKDI